MGFVSDMISQLLSISAMTEVDGIKLNFIGKFIRTLIEGVGSVGLGIIIFTLILKAIVTPLDAWSRISMRKNSLKMEQMRPQLEKLQKQYANDKAMYQQKMMQLYKKEGYSMFGSCLPTIVSLVFFIVVLSAFNTYSQYKTLDNYNQMASAYTYTLEEKVDQGYLTKTENTYTINVDKVIADGVDLSAFTGTDLEKAEAWIKNDARNAAATKYRDLKQNFLWVKNIWVSDVAWSHPIQSYSKFKSSISKSSQVANIEGQYNEVTANLGKEKKAANGYFIFVVISVGVTILSQLVMNKGQKAQLELQTLNGQGRQTQKVMTYIMPIMIGFFAFMYTSAFALYMVTNSVLSMLMTMLINFLVEKNFKRKAEKAYEDKLNKKYGYNHLNTGKKK